VPQKRKRLIYLDHNGTTPLLPEVRRALIDALPDYGNPSSLCVVGRKAKALIEEARQEVARLLGVSTKEIIFTGSGTEANNLAIKGYVEYLRIIGRRKPGEMHIICSSIEHPSVIEVCRALERAGVSVTYLPVTRSGFVRPKDFLAALRGPPTVLASIMLANNEVGTLQPVAQLARIARQQGIAFHTDAVQALGKCTVNVRSLPVQAGLGVDMLSFSGHKIGAPKGVGVLYVRQGIRLAPLIDGGGQERGFRSGTENVIGILGLGAAARVLRKKDYRRHSEKVSALRQRLEQGLRSAIPHTLINTPSRNCLPNTLNVSFEGVEAETIVMNLDLAGVCVSSGSVCDSQLGSRPDPPVRAGQGSPVLRAMGLSSSLARSAVRFSLADTNTPEEIDYVLRILPPIIEKLRRL
jgi:cysteine desulfurase